MQLSRFLSISACGVMAVVLAGCDSGKMEHPNTAPAGGTITYNGSPVEGASVALISAESKKSGWSCSGRTDAAGKFTISTVFAPGTDATGVPEGEYTAVVTKFETQTSTAKDAKGYDALQRERTKGNDPKAPPPQATGPKSLVPARYTTDTTSDLKVKIEKGGKSNIELKLSD